MGIQIFSTGSYLPEKRITNTDLTTFLDTSDEWIFSRTGIKARHIATNGESTTTMGVQAARMALERGGLAPEDIDLVICATVTPDTCVPMTAATIKKELGIESAPAFDLNANCSGFVYAVAAAYSMMKTFPYQNALVIGADVNSQILDWQDRATCVLFGDGAGAAVLSATGSRGILAAALDCASDKEQALLCRNKLDATPFDNGICAGKDTKVKMHGQGVMRFAVRAIPKLVEQVTKQAGVNVGDIRWLVPHQANLRILLSAAKSMGIGMDRIYMNIEETANTSSATIPIALDWMQRDGLMKRGDLLLLIAVGGGLSSGAVLLEW